VVKGGGSLAGLRILVVEDVLLIADVIRDELEDCGCDVVGPVARLQPAITLAREEKLDGAIIDVNLNGELAFPIGDVLRERKIPYVFLTGYDGNSVFPPEYRDTPRLGKPFRSWRFIDFMTRHLKPAPQQ
jgi:CheY-like chemotaxis protein